jgi:hypothetical protein
MFSNTLRHIVNGLHAIRAPNARKTKGPKTGGHRSARFVIEQLEGRCMLAVDLAALVPNLDFEDTNYIPWTLGLMNTPDATVLHWGQLSEGSADFLHVADFMGTPFETGTAPTPTNGSNAFIGFGIDKNLFGPEQEYAEYAANGALIEPLQPGIEYQFDLFVGTPNGGILNTGVNGFEGEVVLYGMFDAQPFLGLVYQYSPKLIEEFAAGNLVELLSVPVDIPANTWADFRHVSFTPEDTIEAIAFGFRTEDSLAYIYVDAAGTPPEVTNITLSSTVSNPYGTNPPYSFGDNVGSGEQLRTVPVGSANTISIQFTEELAALDSDDLELIAINNVFAEPTPTLIQSPELGNDLTAIWSLSSPLPQAQYLLRLQDHITDQDGKALDGEWTNPVAVSTGSGSSEFPSGDGIAGGDFEFIFTILSGDTNTDTVVDLSDLGTFATNLHRGVGMAWEDGDFSGDGLVTLIDLSALATFYNTDWRNLSVLGDYDNDYDVDNDSFGGPSDVDEFYAYYNSSNSNADLDNNGEVNSADESAFASLLAFGIDLD